MWQLKPGQRLRLRAFGDESVLYNDLSGDTHLLGAPAVFLLQRLQDAPAASADLCAGLAEATGSVRDPQFEHDAQALLAQLSALFLIEQLAC